MIIYIVKQTIFHPLIYNTGGPEYMAFCQTLSHSFRKSTLLHKPEDMQLRRYRRG